MSLTAVDGNGWGVDQTYYTTDGIHAHDVEHACTRTVQAEHTGTNTVKYFSTDLAGNAEAVQSPRSWCCTRR